MYVPSILNFSCHLIVLDFCIFKFIYFISRTVFLSYSLHYYYFFKGSHMFLSNRKFHKIV